MDRKAKRGNAMNAKEEVRQGSGNVFADLKLPDAEGLNAKAQIAYRICQILEERKLTQKQAAALLGIDQPRISVIPCRIERRHSVLCFLSSASPALSRAFAGELEVADGGFDQ